jgi:protein-tyrosine-phosphatase
MAEGFARRYGSDVMEVASAGLAPAAIVQPETKQAMQAKNINIDAQFPKDLNQLPVSTFDLIINMSGARLPSRISAPVREWRVEDPIGKSEEIYTAVCNQIENQVQMLILELRRDAKRAAQSAPQPDSPVPARIGGFRNRRR